MSELPVRRWFGLIAATTIGVILLMIGLLVAIIGALDTVHYLFRHAR